MTGKAYGMRKSGYSFGWSAVVSILTRIAQDPLTQERQRRKFLKL